jgi:hypothetical protein
MHLSSQLNKLNDVNRAKESRMDEENTEHYFIHAVLLVWLYEHIYIYIFVYKHESINVYLSTYIITVE